MNVEEKIGGRLDGEKGEREREKDGFFCTTIKNVKGIDRPSFVSFCLLSIYFL